jgi:hypothetical protein
MAAATSNLAPISSARMMRAVEKVRQRLLSAVRALEAAKIPYAVAGGNAVAAWVARVDETAVRNTRDVDILLARSELDNAKRALESAGFIYRRVAMLGQPEGLHLFLDGPQGSVREAVHIVFAGEKVRPDSPATAPDVQEQEEGEFRIVRLDALVRMKLSAFRDKDRTHLRDLIDVGLVDRSWLEKLEPELRRRLQEILDTPEG